VQYSDSYFSYDLWCIKTVQLNNCVIKYRITTVLKVETHIIASIATNSSGWGVILVIMYAKILKTGVIVFICNIIVFICNIIVFICNIIVFICNIIVFICNIIVFICNIIVFIGDVKMCLMSHWSIIFNIKVSSCTCELQTELIFLWIKVSSVI
jgi:hypothetical protein